jgi:hypothetical protein
MAPADVEDARAAQTRESGNLVVGIIGITQSNDLHASLMPRFAAKSSHVGCVHEFELSAAQAI